MQFFIIVLFFCFFIFLYIVYFLANDDLIILRKNISVDKIFTTCFMTSLVSLFSSRLFYVFFNPKPIFFNVLGFLVFPYYPGLSLAGGFIGGIIFLFLYLRHKKMPIGRMFDIIIVSFLIVIPLGTLGTAFLISNPTAIILSSISIIIYSFIAFAFIKYIFPLAFRGSLKSGTLSFLFILSFCVVDFLLNMFKNPNMQLVDKKNIILLIVFCLCLFFYVKREFVKKPILKK